MPVALWKPVICVIDSVMLMKMSFKLFELINMWLFVLPFFSIGYIYEILQQIFDTLIDLISNID